MRGWIGLQAEGSFFHDVRPEGGANARERGVRSKGRLESRPLQRLVPSRLKAAPTSNGYQPPPTSYQLASRRLSRRRVRRHLRLHPAADHFEHFLAVGLDHREVAVAGDPLVLQVDVLRLRA
jgi:hypothetical protein